MKRTVKDALSYLDQVKSKFANQADVYNDFLDMWVESCANPIVLQRSLT
jgi:histone deacetylase complex regulatory component SIN3